MKQIHLDNPDKLEVVVAVVRPKKKEAKDITIIAMAVYFPPNSKKQRKLIDFVTEAYQKLKSKYPAAFFVFGGDVNSLKWSYICDISKEFNSASINQLVRIRFYL